MESPNFYLEAVVREKNEMQDFEGPLNLILMLLSKNKIEIRDLRIADILDQYLEYLEKMQSMDLEIASEFVQMAAHLLYIKTRTLLTQEEEVSELEVLLQSLEQLKAKDTRAALVQVLPTLKKASEQGLLYFPKLPEPLPRSGRVYEYRHEPVDLLRALHSVFSRGQPAGEEQSAQLRSSIPRRIVYSVRSKGQEIIARLRQGDTTLESFYARCASGSELVATIVAVLELCSMGSVRIERKDGLYRMSFLGGDVEEILDRIEE